MSALISIPSQVWTDKSVSTLYFPEVACMVVFIPQGFMEDFPRHSSEMGTPIDLGDIVCMIYFH